MILKKKKKFFYFLTFISSFIETAQQKQCKFFNESNNYEFYLNNKCGLIGQYKDNFPVFFTNTTLDGIWCYSKTLNKFYSSLDPMTQILFPMWSTIRPIISFFMHLVEFILIIVFLVLPEIISTFKKTKRKEILEIIKIIFSLRNQITISMFFVSISTTLIYFIDIFIDLDLFSFFTCYFIRFFILEIIFFEMIVLWSHLQSQTTNGETNLSIKNM